jgi:ribosomal protein L28
LVEFLLEQFSEVARLLFVWLKVMSRVCQLTGKRANNGMAVSHSHVRTKKLQQVNLRSEDHPEEGLGRLRPGTRHQPGQDLKVWAGWSVGAFLRTPAKLPLGSV